LIFRAIERAGLCLQDPRRWHAIHGPDQGSLIGQSGLMTGLTGDFQPLVGGFDLKERMMRKSDIGQPVTQPTVGSDVVWLTSKTPDPLMKNEVLAIGQMVKKFGVTPRTLRFYEGKGLLAPVRNGRARVYAQADQQRLLLILKGRKLGFTVSEISQMLLAAEDRRGPLHSLNTHSRSLGASASNRSNSWNDS
jgi:hypothetical protein